jgi:hypothetical protein
MTVPREERLARWLTDRGIEGSRRVVRASSDVILVSKFEPGFAAHLHEAIDRLPELFELAAVTARYASADMGATRAEGWRLGVSGLLADVGPTRGLDRDQLAEIQAGIDSVAALLDSILWTAPTVGAGGWKVSPAEVTAYEEALGRMDDDSSIFTRYYGHFEGARVENHCPGAQVARRLFTQAWALTTGE